MADRYQGRPFPADDDHRRADSHAPDRAEADPLAELARLIGQTDPFATMGRANHTVQPRGGEREQYQQPAPVDDRPAAGPPPWMQRAARQERPEPPELPQQDYQSRDYQDQDDSDQDYPSQAHPGQDHPDQDYPSAVHPLHRYATPRASAPAAEPHYHEAPSFADGGHEPDPSRYDEALYGQPDAGAQQEAQYGEAYADDPYGYQDGYDDGAEEDQVRKRRGGMMTVVVVLALAVVGTGAAFAYRTYVGTPRSGEPPIIRADAGPTKFVPTPADGTSKLPDRMVSGDGAEKLVPREEAPVDVNARSGPRVVFPPLNPNTNPPPASSVASNALPPASAGNGTLSSNEPRKIRTLAVKGDQPDASATPVGAPPGKPAPATRSVTAAANANASANTPLSLAPQAGQPAVPAPVAEPRARVAATNPAANPEPAAPAPASAAASGAGFLVQVSSQRNEADAQASFRALQGKFPAVLGSRAPVIKRADLGEKGVYYRALVGPFGSSDEATQFCGSLKTAGGQCVIQRN